jgi:hypothetical protein
MGVVTEHQVQPGKWRVEIEHTTGETTMMCSNRPAISFGEDMIRIADIEFEKWMVRSDVKDISVTNENKRSVIQLVEQIDPEELRLYAKKLRDNNDGEEDFKAAQILNGVADMYDDFKEFVVASEEVQQ